MLCRRCKKNRRRKKELEFELELERERLFLSGVDEKRDDSLSETHFLSFFQAPPFSMVGAEDNYAAAAASASQRVVVLDNGGCSIKLGFAGDPHPCEETRRETRERIDEREKGGARSAMTLRFSLNLDLFSSIHKKRVPLGSTPTPSPSPRTTPPSSSATPSTPSRQTPRASR